MNKDEKFVKETWKAAKVCLQARQDGSNLVFWWVFAEGKGPLSTTVHSTKAETWAEAAEFTRERLE